MTEDTSSAKPEGGESIPRGSRSPSRGRRFRRPPRRPRGRPGFRPEEGARGEVEELKTEVETAAPSPEEIEAERAAAEERAAEPPDTRAPDTAEPAESPSQAQEVREEVETARPVEEPGGAVEEPVAETAARTSFEPPPEVPRRERETERRPPPPQQRERFQPRGHGHRHQGPQQRSQHQQHAPRPEPRPPAQPAQPASIARAIDEVKGIIEDLTEALDDMEQVLRILEDAEVQKNADEREIETLRRQLRMLHRREGGQRGHASQSSQNPSSMRREEQGSEGRGDEQQGYNH